MADSVSAAVFADRMAALGPFETDPHLAVAVSGGSDSMALVLLADAWAREHGGRVTALTVDHGLRADAAREARQVADWLAALGIDHHILRWRGPKPQAAIQARARDARYRLLDDWCAGAGALHLLVGHTQDDQAETLMMRLRRGSGPDGLAAMGRERMLHHCRLLRPLLDLPRQALRDFLSTRGQGWLDDPSNRDTRFERARLRDEMLETEALAESARRYGQARQVLERETARLLAASCRFHAAGYATLARDTLAQAPEDLRLRALARVLMAVGGLEHRPARRRVERLAMALGAKTAPALTLGNCLVTAVDGDVRVFRERRNLPAPLVLDGGPLHWDRRFWIAAAPAGYQLRPLAPAGRTALRREAPEILQCARLPEAAFWGLPALVDDGGILAVPHLNYRRDGAAGADGMPLLRFRPPNAASFVAFGVASAGLHTISMEYAEGVRGG